MPLFYIYNISLKTPRILERNFALLSRNNNTWRKARRMRKNISIMHIKQQVSLLFMCRLYLSLSQKLEETGKKKLFLLFHYFSFSFLWLKLLLSMCPHVKPCPNIYPKKKKKPARNFAIRKKNLFKAKIKWKRWICKDRSSLLLNIKLNYTFYLKHSWHWFCVICLYGDSIA